MANSNGWGDGAANNSIGWGQGANNNIGWGDSHAKSWAGLTDIVGITTDPASTEFFTATGITGATQQTAIDNLVKGLKADGLWSKMKAVYPFVTDNRNLFGYTEDFGNGIWEKNKVLVTTNTTVAPNGTTTADTLADNSINGNHTIYQFGTPSSTGSMVGSVYLKNNTRRYAVVTLTTGSSASIRYSAVVDLQTGTITQNNTLGSPTNTSSSIESVGNGWYRVSVRLNCTTTGTTSNYIVVSMSNTATPTTFDSGTLDPSYIGDGSSIFVWGAQLELGSIATTYQPIATTQQAFISSQFKYNLVNPVDSDAAFRLVFNGGWTHSSTGATPNGTNGYADTKLVPSSVLASQNSQHYSMYSRTNIAEAKYGFGGFNLFFALKWSDNLLYAKLGATEYSYGTNATSLGLHILSRTTSTNAPVYVRGTKIDKLSTSSSLLADAVFLGGRNAGGGTADSYGTRQLAFSTIGDGLTDTEASNLYTRVQTFNQALSRQVGVPIVSDADAQAFLNSAEITDITQANAINTLVTDLKAQGLWTKMKAIYPFVGGTATTHKYNLKDPRDLDAAYRLVFNGGWTHSSTGALPNGTNGYADTKLVPSAVLTLNSTHLSFYSRTSGIVSGQRDIGVFIDGNEPCMSLGTNTGVQLSDLYSFATNRLSASIANALGFVNGSRVSSTSHKLFKNGAQIGTTDTFANVITLPNQNVYLGAVNVAPNPVLVTGYSTKQTAFASIGDGLNDTEATALYNAVQNMQISLSRNV